MNINDIITESQQKCPHCGGPVVEYSELGEGKKDACYYKVKASAKVWPSAYASGRLVQCRKKGAANYGNKSEGVAEGLLNEFAPGGAEGAGPYAYGIALKEMAKLYAEGEFDLVDVSGMDTTSQNQSDAEEINSVADAFINRGMEAGREAYRMVDTMVQEDMDEYLDGQGFNVDADIHVAYKNDVDRYNASPEGQAGIAAHEARREAWRRSKPANQVIIQAIDPKGNLPIDNTRVVFDAREFNLEPGFLKYSIEQDIKKIKKTAPGSLIQITLGGKPTDIQGILDQYKQLSKGPHDVAENFADGRNPQDKGDAKRHGINTKASVSSLRKTAKQGGRKGQLAHWLANMKSGRAKNEGVTENTEPEMLFYAKLPEGTKVYARVKDEQQLANLQQQYRGAEIKTFDFQRPDVQKWLEARRINLRKFTPGMVQTMYDVMEAAHTTNFNDDDWYEINPDTKTIVSQRGPQAYHMPFGQRQITLPNGNIVVRGMRAKGMGLDTGLGKPQQKEDGTWGAL
jgi:hypothetical protein